MADKTRTKRRVTNKVLAWFSGIFILLIGVGLAFGADKVAKNAGIQQYFPNNLQVRAVWDWTSLNKVNPNDWPAIAKQLKARQINAVYVDISQVATEKQSGSLANRIDEYIATMHDNGMQVFAAAGDTDWAQPTSQSLPVNVENYVYKYNRDHKSHQFQGIEFDIEAYNQTGFAQSTFTDKGVMLDQYLDTAKLLVDNHIKNASSNSQPLTLGFTIPYWYDNENQNIQSVTWDNKTGPVLYHLLDELNQLPNSNVVVMSYRNIANGNDGSIAHARTEISYAQVKAPKVKVIIGQETTDVQPEKITFFGQSLVDFSQQVDIISSQFNPSGVFGGVAINDLPGYLALKSSAL